MIRHLRVVEQPYKNVISTDWIEDVNRAQLVSYLRECGMDDNGSVTELKRRLSNYVSAGHYDAEQLCRFQELQQRHAQSLSTVSQFQRSCSLGAPKYFQHDPDVHDDDAIERVCEWGLYYNGRGGALQYIEKIEHLAVYKQLNLEQVLLTVYESLSGRARVWWLNHPKQWRNWTEFKQSFLQFFLSKKYWKDLNEKILKLKQGRNQPFKDYVSAMEALMLNTTMTAAQKLNRIYQNSLPMYPMLINPRSFATLEELTDLVTHMEAAGGHLMNNRQIAANPNSRATEANRNNNNCTARCGLIRLVE